MKISKLNKDLIGKWELSDKGLSTNPDYGEIYLPFDNGSLEEKNDRYTGTNNNAVFVPNRFGDERGAVNFGVNASHIEYNGDIVSGLSDVTVNFWVSRVGNLTGSTFCSFYKDGNNHLYSALDGGRIRFGLVVGGANYLAQTSAQIMAFPNVDGWWHISLRYSTSDSLFRIFIGGVEAAYAVQHTYLGGLGFLSGSIVVIGNRIPNSGAYEIKGNIDDFIVFDRILEDSELFSLIEKNAIFKSFVDQSGDRNHLEDNGITLVPSRFGEEKGAVEVSLNNYLSLPEMSNEDFSIAMWVRSISFGGQNTVFGHTDTNAFRTLIIYATDQGNGNIWVQGFYGNGTSTGYSSFGTNYVVNNHTPGDWFHVAVIFGESKLAIYINGEERFSGTRIANRVSNFNPRFPSDYSPSNSDLSDIVMYKGAITLSTVKLLYKTNKPKLVTTSLNKGLVGKWDFTDKSYNPNTLEFIDKSGNKNNLINNGAVFTENRFGEDNSALDFYYNNLNNLYANFERPLTFNMSEPFTLSFWYYPKSIAQYHQHIMNYNKLYFWEGGRFNISNNANTTYVYVISGFSIIQSNNWYMVTLVSDGTNSTVYINGKKGSNTNLRLEGTFIGTFIGDQGSGTSNFKISKFYLYDRDLSEQEIKTLYESNQPKLTISNLNKGLIGKWDFESPKYPFLFNAPLNNNPSDIINEILGTISGGVTATPDRYSTVDNAYNFDGIDGRISYGIAPVPNTGTDISIFCWVKPTTVSGYNYPLMQRTSFSFALLNNVFRLSIQTDSATTGWVDSLINLADGEWHLVGVTLTTKTNTDNVKVYVDGILTNTVSLGGSEWNNAGNLYIGYRDDTQQYYNGSVDDVMFFDYAVSQELVTKLYNSIEFLDKSGNKNYLVNNGATFTTNQYGEENKAIQMLSSNGAYLRSSKPMSFTQSISYVIRYRKSDLEDGLGLINFGTETLHPYDKFGLYVWNNSSVTFLDDSSGSNISVIFQNVTDNEWYEFAVCYEPNTNTVYLYSNGEFKTSRVLGDVLASLKDFPYLWINNGYNNGSGDYDLVKIYDRTLSAKEVKQIYESK
jgi:hypothetical protein